MSLSQYSATDLIAELEKRTKDGIIDRNIDVLMKVADICGVPSMSIIGRDSTKEPLWARMIYVNILRGIYPHWTLKKTAAAIGRTDYTFVQYYVKQAALLYEKDAQFAKLLNKVMKAVRKQP